MTAAEARSAVKTRMSIAGDISTFDSMIDDFISSGMRRLYPRSGYEVASQELTTFQVDNLGEVIIYLTTLTTPLTTTRIVESYDNFAWARVGDTYHHGGQLRLRGLTGVETKLRLYGVNPFTVVDTVYDWLTQCLIWYAMAEFYDYLAGNKKSYTIYMNVSGSRSVDNMADQSAYYDSKADRYLEEQGKTHGG